MSGGVPSPMLECDRHSFGPCSDQSRGSGTPRKFSHGAVDIHCNNIYGDGEVGWMARWRLPPREPSAVETEVTEQTQY